MKKFIFLSLILLFFSTGVEAKEKFNAKKVNEKFDKGHKIEKALLPKNIYKTGRKKNENWERYKHATRKKN